MYQALYRKWRPQTFDEVVGQQHITETLRNQVRTGRLSHAYLFIGTRGTGKTTCARILARAVNCTNPQDGNPCCQCPSCRGILDGSILDVVELDAASNNSVDNVRALREEAVFTPAVVKKRVYIIDEVHMLSNSAFNALLKILEEPPEHLMFILATTELQKVPATILSRCQRHSFKRIDAPVIADYLETIAEREHFTLTRDAAELIARLAEGGVRDALSLLDQCSGHEVIDLDAVYSSMGLAGNRRTLALLEDILAHRTEAALQSFHTLWMDGKDPSVLLTELSGLLRDALMIKVAPKGGKYLLTGAYDSAALQSIGERMTKEELLCAMETLQKALANLRLSASPKITAELCLVSLCDSSLGESVSELRARVSRLEEDFARGIAAAPQARGYAWEEAPPPPEDEYPEPPSYAQEETHTALPVPEAEEEEAPEEPPQEAEAPARFDWPTLARELSAQLPKDIATRLDDASSVRTRLEGSTLRLAVTPGFLYMRFNRQEILSKITEAASRMAGKELRVQLEELSDATMPSRRSIEELKGFKEVNYR